MEAHRQPENRLKGLFSPPGGTSRARSRANLHRIKANGHRNRTHTTGHSAYANDNPVRFTDPFGTCATNQSEADTPCPEPAEPPTPPPPKQPTQLPTVTVTATTITLPRPVFEPTPFPWGRLAGGLLSFGSRVLGPAIAINIAWPTTMDAPACELPGGSLCSNMMSSSYPPGYWPGDAGAAEWGKRKGIGAKAGKDKFHRGVKEHTPGARGDHDYGVNPDTGDVVDQNGEPVGNLNDE